MQQTNPPTDAAQLTQARTATQAAQALADQWQKKADEQRAEIDALTRANIDLWSQLTTAEARRAAAAADAATSIRLMETAQAERNALRADNTALLAIIGADTPIAAFSLAETWQAEKAHLMDEVAALNRLLSIVRAERDSYGAGLMRAAGEYVALEAAARAVVASSTHPTGVYEGRISVDLASLRTLNACVTSSGVEPARAQVGETRAGDKPRPWLGICPKCGTARVKAGECLVCDPRCPRCNSVLNNLSPGISVIAGGISVCSSCVGADEELLRARSL